MHERAHVGRLAVHQQPDLEDLGREPGDTTGGREPDDHGDEYLPDGWWRGRREANHHRKRIHRRDEAECGRLFPFISRGWWKLARVGVMRMLWVPVAASIE